MSVFESRTRWVTLMLLAWRNIWRHRRRTIITLSSVAIGFSLAVAGIGLQDAGHNSMIRNGIQLGEGHITIQQQEYQATPANYRFIQDGGSVLKSLKAININGVVAPRIALQVLANTASNSVGAMLEGIDTEQDTRVERFKTRLVEGQWLQGSDLRGVVVGSGMARKLKLRVGSKLVVMIGKRGGDPEANLGIVRGIYTTGINDIDSYVMLSGISFARRFLIAEGGMAEQQPVTRIAIYLNDVDESKHVLAVIRKSINRQGLAVLSWEQMMPQLLQYITIDDAFNYVLYFLILFVVVVGIINTVLMSVLERTREFGLLRALGMSREYLLWLVFAESLVLSLLAVVSGWVLAGCLHWYLAVEGIDFTAVIGEGTQFMGTVMDPIIRSELSLSRVIQLTVIIFLATLASGIYPAIKAARVTPIEALRT